MFSKKKPLEIRKQTITVATKARPKPVQVYSEQSSTKPRQALPVAQNPRTRDEPIARSSLTSAKRKKLSRHQLLKPNFGQVDESGTDDTDEDVSSGLPKKSKPNHYTENSNARSIPLLEAFSPRASEKFRMIHASDIPSIDKSTKYEAIFDGIGNEIQVELQYPSRSQREHYTLVRATNDTQGFEPIQDIVHVMHQVVEHYLPVSERDRFDNESSGFPRRLIRAVTKRSKDDILQVMREWNDGITEYCNDGTILRILEKSTRVEPSLAERIMNQTHARTVSLNLKWLHKYEAGTDNVYGELLPKFVSQILKDTRMGPSHIFVDLGSGVGNVVLQAALESGCQSWGCEIMEKYCEVANLQHEEFVSRCRLWGLASGDVHLEKGDFLINERIHDALKRADVVLVNNQVFTPQLNESLTTLFLDLKDGCQIVSLKSFVPAGHKISARNSDSPYNVLSVIEKEYFSKCVSWTDQGGKYFISTKDATPLRKFHKSY